MVRRYCTISAIIMLFNLILADLLVYTTVSSATQMCHTCNGNAHCMEGKCHGAYCYMGRYTPFRGMFGVTLKGCLNGSMLATAMADECEANNQLQPLPPDHDAGRKDLACLCRERKYCNRALDKVQRRQRPLVKCYAQGRPTNYCYGHYCAMSLIGSFGTRFCVKQAIPMLEQNLMGACVQPPFFHSLYPDTQAINNTISCVCGDRKCNGRFPNNYHFFARQQLCDVKYTMTVTNPGRLTTKYDIGEAPMCRGQYCYQLNMLRTEGVTNISTSASGCISYVRRWRRSHQILPAGGTLSFESNMLRYRFVVWPRDDRMLNGSYIGDDQLMTTDVSWRSGSSAKDAPVKLPMPEHWLIETSPGDRENHKREHSSSRRTTKHKLQDAALVGAVTLLIVMTVVLLGSCRLGMYKMYRGSYSTVSAK